MKNEIRDLENPLIKSLQKKTMDNEFIQSQAKYLLMFTNQSFTLLYAEFLFFVGDSILAFKTIILYIFGMYI